MERGRIAAIATFIQVVETGSLTAAAGRMGCTPSSVSKQLAALEDGLGVRLLQRTTRRIRVTEAGTALYEQSRDAFDRLQQAEATAKAMTAEISGLVRISASPAYGRARLPSILSALLAEHPHLRFEVTLTARRLDFLEDGIDLAVREGRLEDSTLIARSLGSTPMLWAASKSYLARRGRPRQLADLARHDLLLVPSALPILSKLKIQDRNGAQLKLGPRVVLDDLFALAELAKQGSGIAPLPDYVVEQSGLETVLPRTQLGALALHAVYPSRRGLPRRVQVVLEALEAARLRPAASRQR